MKVALTSVIATFLVAPAAPPDWIQTQTPRATIFYEKGYEADRDFARLWLMRTEDLMKAKYPGAGDRLPGRLLPVFRTQ